MIGANVSEKAALWLLRLRWLAWGAVAALLAIYLAAALAQPGPRHLQLQSQPSPFDRVADHQGEACGCTQNHQTV